MLSSIQCVVLLTCIAASAAIHESFNFLLPPQQRRCFFETLSRDSPAHRVEAFVLSGGNLDVLLTFHGPLIESDILKDFFEDPIFQDTITAAKEIDSETLTYTTEFKPEKPGTYAICLDNRKSRFMSKVVQVGLLFSWKFRGPMTHLLFSCTCMWIDCIAAGRATGIDARDRGRQGQRAPTEDRRRERCPAAGVPHCAERDQPRPDEDPATAEARPPSPRAAQRDEQPELQRGLLGLGLRDPRVHRRRSVSGSYVAYWIQCVAILTCDL